VSKLKTVVGSSAMRRDATIRTLALLVAVSVTLAPVAATSTVLAQEAGVTSRSLADVLVDVAESDGTLTVTRIDLAPADRTDSLRLDGPVVIVVESGSVKVWTRAGTTLDGVPVTSPIATIYATDDQSLSVPAGVRFRIRALGCAPPRLLFVVLASREEGSGR